MFIDTHAHLDFSDFDSDRDEVFARARDAGVEAIINVSSSFEGCLRSLALAGRYEHVYAALGIHPHDVKEIDEAVLREFKKLITSRKVVAIGEVGLDFYRNLSPEDIQKDYFKQFIDISAESGLPLVVHSRAAEAETLKILESSPSLKGVVHCFSGSSDFLSECVGLGLYISFTCNVTYKKSDGLRELVARVPNDRLLLETDCPYLSPEGFRGARNEPHQVRLLARYIADLRGASLEHIAATTTENAKRLFRLRE